MLETITLSRGGILAISAVLVIGALVTGLVLHFVVEASLPLVFLFTCLTPAPLILLLYIGYLVHTDSQSAQYLPILKFLGVLSIIMGLLILLDLLLAGQYLKLNVESKYQMDGEFLIKAGRYSQPLSEKIYNQIAETDQLEIIASLVFRQLVEMKIARGGEIIYSWPFEEKILQFVGGLIFLCPLGLMKKRPDPEKEDRIKFFFLVIAPSYIASLVAIGMWIKLLVTRLT